MSNHIFLAVGMIALFAAGVLFALVSLEVREPFVNPIQVASAIAFIGVALLPILWAPILLAIDTLTT